MARPRKIETAEDLQRNINAYFDSVDNNNANPDNAKDYYTWPDLLIFLGVTQTSADRWITDSEVYPGFKDIIEMAQLKIQAQLVKTALVDSKKTAISAFLLKQKHNGGYTDKPISAADSINVKVTLDGTGHKDAFG